MSEAIVVAIVIAAAGYIGWRFVRALRLARRNAKGGCDSGCGCSPDA